MVNVTVWRRQALQRSVIAAPPAPNFHGGTGHPVPSPRLLPIESL
jgi:hypothetical protein